MRGTRQRKGREGKGMCVTKSCLAGSFARPLPRKVLLAHYLCIWFQKIEVSEKMFDNYQEKAKKIYDKYMLLYFCGYPDEKNPSTAMEFLNQHYDSYRQELSNTAIEILGNAQFNKNINRKVLEQNGLNIIQLYENIHNVSK
jgi:hypothetical protein